MKILHAALVTLVLLPSCGCAAELKPETIAAWDRYIAKLESGWTERFTGPRFFAADDTAERAQKIKKGEVIVRPSVGKDGETSLAGGMISDWTGGFFVYGANLPQVLAFLQDYSHHKVTFAPDIVDSIVRKSNPPDEFDVYLRIVKSKFMVTDYLNSEHKVIWTHPSKTRAYCKSFSTRVAEIVNIGTPKEHELPVGNDRGYVWRMNGYWFVEERDGGVYVEYETVTLSRDVPMLLGKVLGPILHSVPPEALHSSLEKCKKGILATLPQTIRAN